MRLARQFVFSRTPELALLTLFDLDQQQQMRVVKAVPSSVPCIYPTEVGAGYSDLAEGMARAPIDQACALRPYWQPILDRVMDTAYLRLRNDLISVAASIQPFSTGGHLILSAHMAHRTAIELPLAKRVGITAIPDDAKSSAEFMKFLKIITDKDPNGPYPWQSDPRAWPLFHHMILTDNDLDRRAHDLVVPATLAGIASKVRAEQGGSESLLNVLELLRLGKVPIDETSFETLVYSIHGVPAKQPKPPCRVSQVVLRKKGLPPYTDTSVLVSQADNAVNALFDGHGLPAFNVPAADEALVLSIPSSDSTWGQVRDVERQVEERMKHRNQRRTDLHGPYWGRYPLESNTEHHPVEPLAGVIITRIDGGLAAVNAAILGSRPGFSRLLPATTAPLGLLQPVNPEKGFAEYEHEERSA